MAVAFSPDDKLLAASGRNNTVLLWDPSSGEERAALVGHEDEVWCVAFSPDGKYLATGSRDKTVKIWDLASRKAVHTLVGHKGAVTSLSFSADGRLLASAGSDSTVRVWLFQTAREVRTLSGHTAAVNSVMFDRTGRNLASGGSDHTVRVWNVLNGKQIRLLNGHTDSVAAVAYSPDGKVLVSSSFDTTLKVWDGATGRELRTITEHKEPITAVAFSSDDRVFASGGLDHRIEFWDEDTAQGNTIVRTYSVGSVLLTQDGKQFRSGAETSLERDANEMLFAGDSLSSMSFSHDGKILATGSSDYTVRLWETRTNVTVRSLGGHPWEICGLAFSPNSKELVSCGLMGVINVWDVETMRQLSSFPAFGGGASCSSVTFSHDGRKLMCCGDARNIYQEPYIRKTVKIWDYPSLKVLGVYDAHCHQPSEASLDWTGNKLLMASNMTAEIIELSSGKLLRVLSGHSSWVYPVAFSPDDELVVTGSMDKTVRLWNAETGVLIHALKGHTEGVYSVSFSPDGAVLATCGADKSIRLWKVLTGEEIRTIRLDCWPMQVQFSPDGQVLGAFEHGQGVLLFDSGTGRELRRIKAKTEGFAFSPNGRYLATGDDKMVELWDLATGKQLPSYTEFASAAGKR